MPRIKTEAQRRARVREQWLQRPPDKLTMNDVPCPSPPGPARTTATCTHLATLMRLDNERIQCQNCEQPFTSKADNNLKPHV